MLIIRDAQMQVFREAAMREFPAELTRYIQKEQPGNTRSVAGVVLRKRVEHGIAEARACGFRDLKGVAAFVSLMFSLGPRFHRHPSFSAVLTDETIPPERRIQRLREISAWSWRAARDNSEAAWSSVLPKTASTDAN